MQKKPFYVLLATALLAVASLSFFSFQTNKVLDNFWQYLGISKEKGTSQIRESFTSGYLVYWGASKVKNLATGDRSAVAKDLMMYAKTYVSSDAFLQEYQKVRNTSKPIASERKVKSKEELRKEKIEETEKSIRDTERSMKTMSADIVKALVPVIEMQKKMLKDYRDPNSEMINLMYQGELMNKENDEKTYKQRLQEWDNEYPADPSQIIKQRLQHFIDIAETVDFNAALKTVGDKKKFVKQEYEYKSTEWKQMFRAGREIIEPAVAFAKQWLAELK